MTLLFGFDKLQDFKDTVIPNLATFNFVIANYIDQLMPRFIKKIEHIKAGAFACTRDNFFIIQGQNNTSNAINFSCKDYSIEWQKMSNEIFYSDLKISNHYIFFIDDSANSEVYSLKNDELKSKLLDASFFYEINQKLVVFSHQDKATKLIDVENHEYWSINTRLGYPNFNKDNFIFSVKSFLEKDNMICIDGSTGQLLWHFNLKSLHQEYDLFSEKWNKPMEIANFCGVVNEVLWMDVVCRGIGNFLLGLDVNTGQPVHLLDIAENRFMVYPFDMIPTDGRTTYDAKRNILFGFAPDWVHWQVDLSEKSPKIKMWDLSEEMTKHHAYVSAYMNCGISDSHIFFPVGSLGSTPQVFALNRETLKVDWQYFFTEGGQYFTPTKVEVTDTHLYVLDNTGTLHIFEKIEDN